MDALALYMGLGRRQAWSGVPAAPLSMGARRLGCAGSSNAHVARGIRVMGTLHDAADRRDQLARVGGGCPRGPMAVAGINRWLAVGLQCWSGRVLTSSLNRWNPQATAAEVRLTACLST